MDHLRRCHRWGLRTLLDVSAEHESRLRPPPGAETLKKWRESLEKLAPYPSDPKEGYHIAKGVPLKAPQRHFSHLLMVYPLQVYDRP